jgi:hypothetical protein
VRAPEAALFTMLVSYAYEHDTDGGLGSRAGVERYAREMLSDASATRALSALITRGIVREVGSLLYIDGFLDNNPSTEQRRARSVAAKRAAEVRWDAKRNANAMRPHDARQEETRRDTAHDANASTTTSPTTAHEAPSAPPRPPQREGTAPLAEMPEPVSHERHDEWIDRIRRDRTEPRDRRSR